MGSIERVITRFVEPMSFLGKNITIAYGYRSAVRERTPAKLAKIITLFVEPMRRIR